MLASLARIEVNIIDMFKEKKKTKFFSEELYLKMEEVLKKGEQVMFNTKGTKNKTNKEKPQKTNENVDDIYFY